MTQAILFSGHAERHPVMAFWRGRSSSLGSTAELSAFLAGVERHAFTMALTSVKNRDDALDIVQDAMITLASKYADKPEAEYRPLFFRILGNRITDWHRSTGLRRRVFSWLGNEDEADPLLLAEAPAQDSPDQIHDTGYARKELADAIAKLPLRQQQAFMLREFEGMDVESTAFAMGCSAGSVKTHYSRAVQSLREMLVELN